LAAGMMTAGSARVSDRADDATAGLLNSASRTISAARAARTIHGWRLHAGLPMAKWCCREAGCGRLFLRFHWSLLATYFDFLRLEKLTQML